MVNKLVVTAFIFSTVHGLSAMMDEIDPSRPVTPTSGIRQGIEIFPGYRNAPVVTAFRNQALREENRSLAMNSMLMNIQTSFPQDYQRAENEIRKIGSKMEHEVRTPLDLTISEKKLFNLCAQIESKNRRNGQAMD